MKTIFALLCFALLWPGGLSGQTSSSVLFPDPIQEAEETTPSLGPKKVPSIFLTPGGATARAEIKPRGDSPFVGVGPATTALPPLPTPGPAPVGETLPVPVPTSTPTPEAPNPWNVRAEMLMVELPEAQALALLPDLRDEAKVDAAYQRILVDIGQQKAKLISYPVLLLKSGQQGTSETIEEFIYPTQFQSPDLPANFGAGTSGPAASPAPTSPAGYNFAACPTNFEKRNLGITLQIEAAVRPGGKWIDVSLTPQRVIFLGFQWFEALKTPTLSSSVPQPLMFTTKVASSWTVRNGQRVLCGFHKLKQPEGQVELDILQVTATSTED